MITTNTYSGGIDQDSSPQKVQNTSYIMLKDGHVVTEGGLSTGAVENEKGTALAFIIPDTYQKYKIEFTLTTTNPVGIATDAIIEIPTSATPGPWIYGAGTAIDDIYANLLVTFAADIAVGNFVILFNGWNTITIIGLDAPLTVNTPPNSPPNSATSTLCIDAQTGLMINGWSRSRDEIVVHTTNCTKKTPGRNGVAESGGQIWKIRFDEVSKRVEDSTPTYYLVSSKHLYYNDMLNYSVYNRVKSSVNRYESSIFHKTYFTDGYNYIRHFNFNDPNRLMLEPQQLFLLNDTVFTVPLLNDILTGGGLTSARYQYCYQLFNNYGIESLISPCSDLIDITSYDDKTLDSGLYRGNTDEYNANTTIEVLISSPDSRYTNIRFIALKYADMYADPEIRILEERSIDSTQITFTDSGDPGIGELTVAEFRALGGKLFICQTIEPKNAKLFAGNIEEGYFDLDFDARCFRYRWDNFINQEATYVGSDAFTSLNERDDINPFNYMTNDTDHLKRFCYKKGFTSVTHGDAEGRFGGTGLEEIGPGIPNVEYEFKLLGMSDGMGSLDSDQGWGGADELYVWADPGPLKHYPNLIGGNVNNSWYSYAGPYTSDLYRGYQRDEVYRFGIVLFDKYYRPGFVKWIGDIRMPSLNDSDSVYTTGYWINRANGGFNVSQAYALYPEFTINLPPSITDQISGFSIVRVKREGNDRTILAQGYISRYWLGGGPYVLPITGPEAIDNDIVCKISTAFDNPANAEVYNPDNVYRFYSPEVNFNKNLVVRGGDNFRIEGYSIPPAHLSTPTGITIKIDDTTPLLNAIVTDHNWENASDAGLIGNYVEEIQSGIIDNVDPHETALVTNTCLYGYLQHFIPFDRMTNYNTPGVPGTWHTTQRSWAIANYRRPLTSQYGGASRSNRSNNEYMWCNNFTRVEDMISNPGYKTAVVKVFGGDTFIGYFDYYRYHHPVPAKTVAVYLPVESSINLALRHDPCYSKTVAAGAPNDFVAEYGNPTVYNAETFETPDLYAYNSAYSREPDVIKFFPKPWNYQPEYRHDCEILNTNKRYTDEITDNWTKFLYDDFTEVEQTYGAITKLIDHNNVMYFIQEGGFGAMAIDERVTTLDTTGATMVLGTGETLGKFGYISKSSGSIHHDSIVSAASGLHYFDIRNRKWMIYTGEANSPLNDLKGLSAFFMNNLKGNIQTHDKPLYDDNYPAGITGIYEQKRERVIMTFLDWKTTTAGQHITYSQEKYTVSYNELLKAYESFYSFYPGLYLYSRDRLMSVDSGTMNTAYVHNEGIRGIYYGNPAVSTEITIVANPDADISKIFTNLEFNTQVTIANVDQFDNTMDWLQSWNSYQDSGIIQLIPETTIRRRFRTWRVDLPRDNDMKSTTFDITKSYDNRLFDRYTFLKLAFDNAADARLILHDLITHYIQKPL